MLIDDKNHFQFVPALEYMAVTKIIGTLLSDPGYREMIKDAAGSLRPEQSSRRPLHDMIEGVRTRVDRLPVPESLKTLFNHFVASMVYDTAHWLVCVSHNTPGRLKEEYWTETICKLTRHLQRDNFGCVNGRKTLESYVSKRKTVNFVIWNQLCFHCMEDEIIRFSKTIDWKKCDGSIDSILTIYWYQKIFGSLPAKRMWRPRFFKFFKKNSGYELALDEGKILSTMFSENYRFIPQYGKTPSGIRYFRNYLEDGEEFTELAPHTDYWSITREVLLYLLRTTKGTTLFTSTMEKYKMILADSLTQLPLILFIDDWISVFDTIDVTYCAYFFSNVGDLNWRTAADRYITFHQPFEKVWRICYRRFGSTPREMGRVIGEICLKQDVKFVEFIFKELENHQRVPLIEDLVNHVRPLRGASFLEKFLVQVSEQVLNSDEERKLFSKLPKFRFTYDASRRMILFPR